uniref:Uncharacterized protein n=1 Tax=Tanacetum cinerariifolium TaxID=118510 RepID=A0A6L2P4N4_TANCI|nr:hypothetical protein [Tanacetum cinerariifolium]
MNGRRLRRNMCGLWFVVLNRRSEKYTKNITVTWSERSGSGSRRRMRVSQLHESQLAFALSLGQIKIRWFNSMISICCVILISISMTMMVILMKIIIGGSRFDERMICFLLYPDYP